MTKEINIWNIKFNPYTRRQIVDIVEEWLKTGRRGIHLTGVNPETVVMAQKNAELKQAILESDIVNIDNTLVMYSLRANGYTIPERAATPDVFELMLQAAETEGQTVFFLGATEQVSAKLEENVRKQYPRLRIVGRRNGFYSDEDQIVREIAELAPDYLFLGLPSPQKECFILHHKRELNCGVCYGVGGAFDVKGDFVKRAPEWLCRIGLEGTVRILHGPVRYGSRIFKFYPTFLHLVISELSYHRNKTKKYQNRSQESLCSDK